MTIKREEMNKDYIETGSQDFAEEKRFNMLPGPSCEVSQLYFARINLCNVTWGDIVLAIKDCKKTNIWSDWGDWHDKWKIRAKVFDDKGREAAAKGLQVTARDMLLRAAACYHFAEFMFFADPKEKEKTRRLVTDLFHEAIPFLGHSCNPIKIPYQGSELPGYLMAPGDKGPYPCVILNNGMESAKEAELYAFAQAFLARGMAVLAFDGPGQGELLGKKGMVVDWENVIGAALDAVCQRPEVDNDRIGMFGVSFGGYLCLRGAAFHQDRVKAAINLSGCYDIDNFPQLRGMVLDDFCYVFQLDPQQMNDLAIAQLNLRTAPALERPLLTIHSKTDSLFPFATAERVHEWARGEKELISYDHEWHVCTNHMSEFIPYFCDWMSEKLAKANA